MNINEVITVFFTLFAVIDMLGSIPILVSLKEKIPDINPTKVTLASASLMIGFLYVGDYFLKYLFQTLVLIQIMRRNILYIIILI